MFSYRFLITFCRGPDHLKMSENASQNGASGHPKSQKSKKTEHAKKPQKNNTQKVWFRMQNDLKIEVLFRSRSAPEITKIHKILKIGLRTSKITKNLDSDLPKSLKIMISTSQNLEILIANCLLFALKQKTRNEK